MSAYVLLEDGTRFDGESVGAPVSMTGEVVFTTGMSGYQESMTDPSFARQLITFTTAHVGNYGVSEAGDGVRPHPRGRARSCARRSTTTTRRRAEQGWLSWLSENGIPGIHGVDTRALVRHIRSEGAMRGGIFQDDVPVSEARERIDAEPSMVGRDLAREVTIAAPRTYEGDGRPADRRPRHRDQARRSSATSPSRGATLEIYPCTTPADELLATDPDGFFLVPGPGDPAALDYIVENIRTLLTTKPVFGICLGHQLLVPRRRPGDLQAPVRPPRRQPPGQGPPDRPDRDHRRRTTASRSRASPARSSSPTSARPSSPT